MTIKFTGRRRYRVHRTFFRRKLLVLQLEYTWARSRYPGCDYTLPSTDEVTTYHWRDARTEDITIEENHHDRTRTKAAYA